jgi:hypothetical protein
MAAQLRQCVAAVALVWILAGDAAAQIAAPATIPSSPAFDATFENALAAPITPWHWEWLPQGLIYSSYLAGVQEPRLAARFVHETDQGTLFDGTLGGRFGLVRFGPPGLVEGFQIDVAAAAHVRLDLEEDRDLLGANYRFDLPLTYGVGPHRFKFAYYHDSAHVGDEFLLKNPGFQRLNYVRDALVLGYSYYPVPEVRLYGEAGWGFYTDVSQPWEFQFGIDIFPARPTGPFGAPFLALNGHLREEVDFGGNFVAEAGWAWRGERYADGLLRAGLYFYDGKSPQFSFFNRHEQQIGLGFWYDF